MARFTYTGAKRREISFPLGGIGAGCLGLDGSGRLRDWEIFNRPNKGSVNGFSHFGVKAERDGKLLDARVMNADLEPPYTGQAARDAHYKGYGFGPSRYLLGGVPHFRDSVFTGEFPFARIDFQDEDFPGQAALSAFNPFIPSDDVSSSIPAAFFTAEVTNTTAEAIDYTFELSVNNPAEGRHTNALLQTEALTGACLSGEADSDSPKFGAVAFGVPTGEGTAVQQYWYRGSWFDNLGVFWQDFCAPGPLKNRVYEDGAEGVYNVREDVATVAVRKTVAPGETYAQRFVLAWYYPNCVNYWSEAPCNQVDACFQSDEIWHNFYARLFDDAPAVAEFCLRNWDGLEEKTRRFHDALYASTIPDAALEALTANISILKSPTCLRLEDGEFYGFEGCHCDCGCCEGSCTHVWNYAFALPFLFPKLERSMRELDYTFNLREDGGMPFRLQLPLGRPRSAFRPCVDGQMGGLIKTYREWKISGDDEWLKRWWPKAKLSLEFAWSPSNYDHWDPDKTGVIAGRQHHTLDMELFGPNAWLNAFYLGALKAGAEMARAVGEEAEAAEYLRLYEAGRAYTDTALYNGEYYFQKVDLHDKAMLERYNEGGTLTGGSAAEVYWSDEAGQLKYQIGDGCGVDQVLAQWMCELSGLGEILDPAHVQSALSAIYRNNFKADMRKHFNPCRIYGLNDESGLTICDWPEGREKPVVPIPYAEEAMNGFEYQAACHMIMHGLEAEGLRVVKGVRDRYDGERRNPWNEFECGNNYARSMASYALLLAYSGFVFDMGKQRMGFRPLRPGKYFWSLDGAWGTCEMNERGAELDVLYGQLSLREWVIPQAEAVRGLCLNGAKLDFAAREGAVVPQSPLKLAEGAKLAARYGEN